MGHMIAAYWCVLIAALMPIAFVGHAKFSGKKKLGTEENARPREWLEQLEGSQKRAYWAQLNAFEAFPPFAAGVIIAVLAGASVTAINTLAILFIIFRIVYGVCYIKNIATARSIIWSLGLACVIALFVVAAV